MADKSQFTVRLIDRVKGPARSAEKALGSLSSKARGLSATSAALAKSSGRTSAALGMLGRASAGAGRSISRGLGGALDVFKGNLITMAAQKALGLAAAVAETGFEFVTFGQNARLGFANLAKHGAQPEALFEHARVLAKRFGLDVLDTSKQYQKFLALQFTPKAIDGLIKMGADLRIVGADAEAVQGIFTALGQIKGKGKLQGEELLQLAERNVSTAVVQEEIGKLLGGKSQAEVQKLMQAGKVTADVGLKAIQSAINRKLQQNRLGESGAKFADQTISGMLGRFKALGQDAGLQAFDRAAAPITKVLGRTLDKLIAFIDSPAGAKLIDQLAGSIERLATAGAELGGDLATKFIEADWKAIGKEIGEIASGLVAAARAGLELAKALGLGGDTSGPKTGAAQAEPAAGRASVAGFAAGGALVGTLFGPLGTLVGGLAGAGLAKAENFLDDWTAFGLSMTKGMSSEPVLASARAAGAAIGDSTSAGARDALGIHSPSRVAMADGVQVARGLAIGMRRGARHVDAANASLAGGIGFGPGSFATLGPAMSSASAPDVAARAGSPGRVQVTQNIVIDGASGNAEEIGRVAGREARRELESFFRHLALEGG